MTTHTHSSLVRGWFFLLLLLDRSVAAMLEPEDDGCDADPEDYVGNPMPPKIPTSITWTVWPISNEINPLESGGWKETTVTVTVPSSTLFLTVTSTVTLEPPLIPAPPGLAPPMPQPSVSTSRSFTNSSSAATSSSITTSNWSNTSRFSPPSTTTAVNTALTTIQDIPAGPSTTRSPTNPKHSFDYHNQLTTLNILDGKEPASAVAEEAEIVIIPIDGRGGGLQEPLASETYSPSTYGMPTFNPPPPPPTYSPPPPSTSRVTTTTTTTTTNPLGAISPIDSSSSAGPISVVPIDVTTPKTWPIGYSYSTSSTTAKAKTTTTTPPSLPSPSPSTRASSTGDEHNPLTSILPLDGITILSLTGPNDGTLPGGGPPPTSPTSTSTSGPGAGRRADYNGTIWPVAGSVAAMAAAPLVALWLIL